MMAASLAFAAPRHINAGARVDQGYSPALSGGVRGSLLPARTPPLGGVEGSAFPGVAAFVTTAHVVARCRRSRRTAAYAAKTETAKKQTKVISMEEAQDVLFSPIPVEEARPAEEKVHFDVFKPDTYGSITMDDVKKYGAAGTLAYVLTELAFWAIAVPSEGAIFYETVGRWPDFSNDIDKAEVLGFVFAASNIARLCLPLRFGAALALAPWVDENIIVRFGGKSSEA